MAARCSSRSLRRWASEPGFVPCYLALGMLEGVADRDLISRIGRGDAREMEAELCRRFAPRVRLYGLRHLRSADRAADLVQEVLLAVLEAARKGRIEEGDHVDRFVLGTCRHIAARVRQRDARATPAADVGHDLAADMPPLEAVDVGALIQCMSKLDARSRTVLGMTFEAESRADEIATAMNTSVGNVRVVRHRALAQLRSCLDGARGADR